MKSQEPCVRAESDHYINVPSMSAKRMFFYPIHLGHMYYEPGYHTERSRSAGYLLIYVMDGSLNMIYQGVTTAIPQRTFLLIDCAHPHALSTCQPCEVMLLLIDGPQAAAYYESIVARLGNIFATTDPTLAYNRMENIYSEFTKGKGVSEPYVSKLLNDTLTYFLLQPPVNELLKENADVIANVVNYIRERFRDNLTNETLAAYASMSTWHFIRIFKQETGMTPHQYVLTTRFQQAELLLRNTDLPTKEICYMAGFTSESVFCTAFKKRVGVSPQMFRKMA